MSTFAKILIDWQARGGRHDLPWQRSRDPYRVWLSEVMLQQTQVSAVVPYYERFLARFPDLASLARAPEEDVLRLWSGLGYYARARNLHRAAQQIVNRLDGHFPDTVQALAGLPGLGRSSAAAIAVFAFGRREAILDGNVKRVLARAFGVEGFPGTPAIETRLWQRAERLLPHQGIEAYTQALMDLGATVCLRKAPRCEACPLVRRCLARRTGRIAQLPAPRPRREIPLRRATWLVLMRKGEVLLQSRPAPGVWGGLWAFPEAPTRGIRAFCRRAFGLEAEKVRRLGSIEHGFTHFRLQAKPVLYRVTGALPRGKASSARWFTPRAGARAAVPAPVRELLRRLGPRSANG